MYNKKNCIHLNTKIICNQNFIELFRLIMKTANLGYVGKERGINYNFYLFVEKLKVNCLNALSV